MPKEPDAQVSLEAPRFGRLIKGEDIDLATPVGSRLFFRCSSALDSGVELERVFSDGAVPGGSMSCRFTVNDELALYPDPRIVFARWSIPDQI